MIEHRTSYVYLFSFTKSFIKTNKNNWGSRKKKKKAIKDHGKHLVESNEHVEKDFNIDRNNIPLEEKQI